MSTPSQPAERRLEIRWADPKEILAAVAAGSYRTGLEFLQAMLAGNVPRPPIGALLGYDAKEFSEGRAVFTTVPGEQHYNPMGVVHGGVAATLLDTAMACSIHTLLPIDVGYTTLELKINYLRPMTTGIGEVRAIGKVVHLGKRTGVAEGRLLDSKDRVLAHGSTTCLIFEATATDRK